jgi:4-amino-4-deoxy-L-arabinose transferase-like glycosyltransferase
MPSVLPQTVSSRMVLAAILLAAFCFRVSDLSGNPPGFFCDEADIANNARALAAHGRDIYGQRFPVFFHGLGDYKNPVPIYSAIPFISTLGMTVFAARLPAVLYGVLAVAAIFVLVGQFCGEPAGLWSALLMAISPWHIHLSRIGMEFSPVIFWTTAWLATVPFVLRGSGRRPLAAFYACAVLALLSYYSAWFYLPAIALLLILFFWPRFRELLRTRSFWAVTFAFTVGFLALVLRHILDGSFLTRWHSTRANSFGIGWLAEGYWRHFRPDFLFSAGDSGSGAEVFRHSVIGMGELYWFQLPLLAAVPIAWLTAPRARRPIGFLACLLLVYPLGTVLTSLHPYATRSYLGAIAFTALSGIGLSAVTGIAARSRLGRSLAVLTVTVVIPASFAVFVHLQQLYKLRAYGWEGWQAGMRESLAQLAPQQARYARLRITHLFNSGEALLAFFEHEYPCPKCSLFPPEFVPSGDPQELFSLRIVDRDILLYRAPYLSFHRTGAIRFDDSNDAFVIGTFTPRQPGHEPSR